MKITKQNLKHIIEEELQEILGSDFATAAGRQQDIDMRGARGDFEKGDYGMHGQPGELSDYGEYPWIQDALRDLQDEDLISKQKAVQALADELGVTVRKLK